LTTISNSYLGPTPITPKMDEIIENDYNLNITRYVSTATPEPIIDLGKTHEAIVAAEKDVRTMTAKHNDFLKQLGLPPLP